MKILKKLIIFCEGTDGVGKSTIAKKLSNILDLPLVRMVKTDTAFKRKIIEDFAYVFNNVLCQIRNLSYIVDRGPLSSVIYSQIYQRKSKLSYIYPILEKIKPVVLFLTTSKMSVIFERKKIDKIILFADRQKIWQGYEDFFSTQQLVECFRIDTTNKTVPQITNEILKYLQREKYIEI